MSGTDIIVWAAICFGFVLFLAGLATWERWRFTHRDLAAHPDGPNPRLSTDAAFRDGASSYRVTALPAPGPVWLFRSDLDRHRPVGPRANDPVTAIAGPILLSIGPRVARRLIASTDRRWKVVVDRKDKPNLAFFHAVSVEVFRTRAEAENRRDEVVADWSPNWKYATMPRLAHSAITAARKAAPAYAPGPKPPLSRSARIGRRVVAFTMTSVGVLFTLFWIVGAGGAAAEGVSASGTVGDYVTTIIVAVLLALIGTGVTLGGWRLFKRSE